MYIYINLLTYLLITCSMEQSPSQLVKKFPVFYATRKFITALTSPRHLSVSSARSTQSLPKPFQFLKIHPNIIFPFKPRSSKWSLSLRFPPPKRCIYVYFSCLP